MSIIEFNLINRQTRERGRNLLLPQAMPLLIKN